MDSIIQNIDDLDENDLNFDGLDSDTEEHTTTTSRTKSNKSANTSKSPQSKTTPTQNDEEDEILFKIPLDIPSTNRVQCGKNEEVNADAFNFNEDDAEDDFIRTQLIFSSTQSTSANSSSDTTPVFKIPVIK